MLCYNSLYHTPAKDATAQRPGAQEQEPQPLHPPRVAGGREDDLRLLRFDVETLQI